MFDACASCRWACDVQADCPDKNTTRRIRVQQRSFGALVAALDRKFQVAGGRWTVTVVPNIKVEDDDDVGSLQSGDRLIVRHVTASSPSNHTGQTSDSAGDVPAEGVKGGSDTPQAKGKVRRRRRAKKNKSA